VAVAVTWHVTVWPFVREEVVKTGLLVPAFVPFTFHCHEFPVPPLTVAVKVALPPLQTGFDPPVCAIVAVALPAGRIVSEIPLDVAVEVVVQMALLVSTQVTVCPFVILLLLKTALLVPAFTPFTFH
jgi:hypothetical protein